MLDTDTPLVQEAPPLVEVKASILPLRLSNGTTTVPFGWTTGCPPRPLSFPAVEIGTLQVSTAVGGGAHVLEVALAEVIELGVAVTAEPAVRAVVTDRPVLVQVDFAHRWRRNRDGQSSTSARRRSIGSRRPWER